MDRAALRRAAVKGWLTLTPDLGDWALAVWRRQCLRAHWPFVVVRPEPGRATLWVVLPPGREWGVRDWQMVRDALSHAGGVVLQSEGVRAFLSPRMEETVAPRLIALALAASPIERQADWQASCASLN